MSPEMLGTVGPIVVMIAIFYFLLYRPQKNQQKKRMSMLDSLKKGDKVVTIGGIYGTIEALSDKSLKLKIADRVVIEVARASINAVLTEETEAK
ncbi:preprotein translocase subunit YajC [Mitsuokella sp. AF33-22]|uniref:preprotein translocase subunit YajC n=1 Tax=Mitsuokella sp. AF33-22 TaxID=2292047 RepID=UPI000E5265AE|nr:preprotein translocase subunit YajC [Mitsuokella sp. AF33-22]RHM56419.1 preprotein translocase subunit YajC [Mitsuokella sp. AF33-22]